MKHTSPTAIKWRTPWKCSKAKINLSPEKLQHLDRRKAMLQKAVVHFTAKAPSILSLLKLNIFFITFSPHLLPFSILLLYMVFLLWWYIPSSCYFWLLLYSMSSVHVSPYLWSSAWFHLSRTVSSALLICSLSKKWLGCCFFSFFPTCLFWNKQLEIRWTSQLSILASHTTSHYNSTNKLQNLSCKGIDTSCFLDCACLFCGWEEGVLWFYSDFLQCMSMLRLCCVVWPVQAIFELKGLRLQVAYDDMW